MSAIKKDLLQLKGQLKLYILTLWDDKRNLLVAMLFPILAAFIVVWIAGENMFVTYESTKSGSFVIISAAIWGGLFNSIQSIVKERANIKRDCMAGLKIRMFILSRALVQAVLCLLQSFVLSLAYVGIVYLRGNSIPERGLVIDCTYVEYYITIFLVMYAADLMGLLISSLVKKTETANVLSPYVLITQLIFSGILFAMEGVAEKVSYLMISKWGMEALGSTSRLNDINLKIQEEFPMVIHEAEELFTSTDEHLLRVWAILGVFCVVFLVLASVFLRNVTKDTR